MIHRSTIALGALILAMSGTLLGTATADAAKARNCAALNKTYPHGVGQPGARDKVAAGKRPVTTFRVNRAAYLENRGLDRDRDGIACEKK
ncbi:excalibur calcium-binding domain-containing protein [Williamsia sp. CHRR-6]|uniref:excalibur calcium-binding domain-containing protein n=1 Tax=Williamsia sp. CHRR-6 TaxID=2835871 RepID=UPI001BDA1F9E|nr:excalibur calcium-binding domain-containing protein [Williamsia sp. CHRR-6]MBT0565748.1 excalibur calcium-binding domain-containing protein [Williamsia sp. CHRR-6]